MESFIHEDFLLTTPIARTLFHEVAEGLPIVDFHSHLDPQALANDCTFGSISELWIRSDPYKHRAMRLCGVPEEQITGNVSDRALFGHWAETVPKTLGNPLYHWTALELARYFGIHEPLNSGNAERIWQEANRQLAAPSHSARGLLQQANVECICTSDRLLDDLSAHRSLAQTSTFRVLPSLRGDDVLLLDPEWLSELVGGDRTFGAFTEAVANRLDRFDELGCRLADHALDSFVYVPTPIDEAAALYEQHANGGTLALDERTRLRSAILRWLGQQYASRNWIMQLHIGALRSTSSRLRRLAGPAGGYASVGNSVDLPSLAGFLDALESEDGLPRTILYNLNPTDNAALATLTGSFAQDGVAGKVQFGPAWWYNDHRLGIEAQLESVAAYGLLSTFIGMTTDSRSLLSMPRHEYFRRLLCEWIGQQVVQGRFPSDEPLLRNLVRAISYENAARALSLRSATGLDHD